jgi:hypothetical protein
MEEDGLPVNRTHSTEMRSGDRPAAEMRAATLRDAHWVRAGGLGFHCQE